MPWTPMGEGLLHAPGADTARQRQRTPEHPKLLRVCTPTPCCAHVALSAGPDCVVGGVSVTKRQHTTCSAPSPLTALTCGWNIGHPMVHKASNVTRGDGGCQGGESQPRRIGENSCSWFSNHRRQASQFSLLYCPVCSYMSIWCHNRPSRGRLLLRPPQPCSRAPQPPPLL